MLVNYTLNSSRSVSYFPQFETNAFTQVHLLLQIQIHLFWYMYSFHPYTGWFIYVELTLRSNCLSYCPLKQYSWGGKSLYPSFDLSTASHNRNYTQPQAHLKCWVIFWWWWELSRQKAAVAASALYTRGRLTYTSFPVSYSLLLCVGVINNPSPPLSLHIKIRSVFWGLNTSLVSRPREMQWSQSSFRLLRTANSLNVPSALMVWTKIKNTSSHTSHCVYKGIVWQFHFSLAQWPSGNPLPDEDYRIISSNSFHPWKADNLSD